MQVNQVLDTISNKNYDFALQKIVEYHFMKFDVIALSISGKAQKFSEKGSNYIDFIKSPLVSDEFIRMHRALIAHIKPHQR